MTKVTIENINRKEYAQLFEREEVPAMWEEIIFDENIKVINLQNHQSNLADGEVWSFVVQSLVQIPFDVSAILIADFLKKLLLKLKKNKAKIKINNKELESLETDEIIKRIEAEDD